jgi:Tol biopolymer transport system component
LDQLGPKWSPDLESVLTFKEHTTDGYIVALYGGLPTDFNAWPSTPYRFLTDANQSGDISWSPNGSEVVFSSEASEPVGIYYVSDWASWLAAGASYVPDPLVVEPQRNHWARWRPNSH